MSASRSDWVNGLVETIDRAYLLNGAELRATAAVVYQILSTLRIPQRGEPVSLPIFVVASSGAGHEHLDRAVVEVTTAQVVPPRTWSKMVLSQILQSWPDVSEEEVGTATRMFTELFVTLEAQSRNIAELPVLLMQ